MLCNGWNTGAWHGWHRRRSKAVEDRKVSGSRMGGKDRELFENWIFDFPVKCDNNTIFDSFEKLFLETQFMADTSFTKECGLPLAKPEKKPSLNSYIEPWLTLNQKILIEDSNYMSDGQGGRGARWSPWPGILWESPPSAPYMTVLSKAIYGPWHVLPWLCGSAY